jgi:DNA-binding MarR family transcriptional regulator
VSTGVIQRAIRQSKPFQSTSQEAILGLLMVADRLKREVAVVTDPLGITHQQYNVLRILKGAGLDGLATLSIAERMVERTPGITRLIDRLERKALVRRERCPEDRRLVRCHITPEGLELLDRLAGPIGAIDHQGLGMLSEKERGQLVGLLERILAAPN